MLNNQKMSIDLRIVTLVLFIALVGTLVWAKPWQAEVSRTIKISGEATKEAEPDEYQFSPSYQEKGADRTAIQKQLTDKINLVVTKLKELGVDESDITLSSYTYDNYWMDGNEEVTSNTVNVTVDNKELSQKVQDYLLTTSPEGQLTPVVNFSTEKRKLLEDEVRSDAIADAKKKADRTVGELGSKLGKVVTIEDQSGGFAIPYYGAVGSEIAVSSDASTRSSLPVLPGKQDITYTVHVTYEIK